MINKPCPLNGGHNTDPNIKALKGKGFINHGPTLGFLEVRTRDCIRTGFTVGSQALVLEVLPVAAMVFGSHSQ